MNHGAGGGKPGWSFFTRHGVGQKPAIFRQRTAMAFLGWLTIGIVEAGTTGKGAIRDESVYCQQTRTGQVIPKPYDRTYDQIPCGPNFQPRPQTGSCVYTMDPEQIDDMLQARPDGCSRFGRNQVICQADPQSGCATPPLQGSNVDEWDAWNQALASAISDEFQKHTGDFRSQYGGARVPLKVHVKYAVVKEPWIYNKKRLDYHIVIETWTADAIPKGYYNLTSQQLQQLQQAFVAYIQQSLYATQASYQSRLKFPAKETPPPNGRYPKTGDFGNDPSAPALTYGDGPTTRF